MEDAAPFRSAEMVVRPEWIDYNGHMNLAYYQVLFDRAVDELWETLGLGPQYRAERGLTTFAAEAHLCYLREIHEGDRVVSTARIVDFDEKRLHLYQELFHADGWLSASAEIMTLSIDGRGPKVAPWPADILARIAARSAGDARLPPPTRIGRSVAIRRASP